MTPNCLMIPAGLLALGDAGLLFYLVMGACRDLENRECEEDHPVKTFLVAFIGYIIVMMVMCASVIKQRQQFNGEVYMVGAV